MATPWHQEEHPDLEEDCFKLSLIMLPEQCDHLVLEEEMTEKRWHIIIRYHADRGFRDIERDIDELEELADIVECGPSWYAIKGIVITHNRRTSETRTIEQAAAE